MAEDYRNNRYGSARFAKKKDIKRAGLLGNAGNYFGVCPYSGKPLRKEVTSAITVGGAQSGKSRDILIAQALTDSRSMLVNDTKGEIAASTLHHQISLGKKAYCFNPAGMHASAPWFLPMHRINPLDILTPNSPTLISDTDVVMKMLIKSTGDSRAEFFELRAEEWCGAIALWLARSQDRIIDLPELYSVLNIIDANPAYWDQLLDRYLLRCPDESIRRVAGEMRYKRVKAPGEFSGIMSTIFKNLNCLKDPMLSESLSNPDVSLREIAIEPLTIYNVSPAEYTESWSPIHRAIYGVSMLYKQRNLVGGPLILLMDEAAHFDRFEKLEWAYTHGQGFGIIPWAIFQSHGQIVNKYGDSGSQIILGSSQVRQFFGVRDYDTAKMISNMLGTQTVSFKNAHGQDRGAQLKAEILNEIARGQDPGELTMSLGFQQDTNDESERPLMTPGEIMQMPENQQLLFISGLDCPPIKAAKIPYYRQQSLSGRYLPNPHYPPYNSVTVAGWKNRAIRKPIRIENVPDELRHWPQYQAGLRPVIGDTRQLGEGPGRLIRLIGG